MNRFTGRATIAASIAGLLLSACQGEVTGQPASREGTTPSPVAGQCRAVDGKADRRCTPGALNPDVTQATIHSTICVPGWTKTVRPATVYTNELKQRQLAQYGETGPLGAFEEDHLINLGIGGAPQDPRNLWPQPRNGARTAETKDREEVQLQREVCAGTLTLEQAQQQILMDWTY